MIRRAGPEDRATLLTLTAEFYQVDDHPFDMSVVEAGVDPLLANDEYGIVLITDDGYAVVTWSYSLESGGRDALLDELYVRRRSRGIGSSLIEAIFSEMRARGLRRIFLETEPSNQEARSFYQRHGFRIEDSVWMAADIG